MVPTIQQFFLIYMKNILITGAAGFIGAQLSKALTLSNYNITQIDNLSVKPILLEDSSLIKIDVQSIDSNFLKKNNIDQVVHLAAKKNVKESFYNLNHAVENFDMTLRLFDACAHSNVKRVFLASTCEIFGFQENILDEKSEFNPFSPYAVSKVANEYLANVYMRYEKKMKITSLNFFNTYGPTEGTDAVIPNFVLKAIRNQDIIIEGDGSQARDFTYIDDTIRSLASIIKNEIDYFRYLNIGSGFDHKIIDIANIIKSHFENLNIKYIEPRPNEVQTFIADNTIMKQNYGFTQKIQLKEGIKKVIDFHIQREN